MFRWAMLSGRFCSYGALLALGVLVAASGVARGEEPADHVAGLKPKMAEAYSQLPMSFEANHGQVAGPIKFMSRGNGYGLFLTGQEAVLTLQKPAKNSIQKLASRLPHLTANGIAMSQGGAKAPGRPQPLADGDVAMGRLDTSADKQSDVVRMQLLGANPDVSLWGLIGFPG